MGYTVADLAYRHPTARVIGLEMDAANAQLARRNTGWLGPRVTILHAAAWTVDGEIRYAGEADDAFAISDRPGDGLRSAPAMSMATLFAEQAIDRADYVKMDIEGAEAAVFAGQLQWLDRIGAMKIGSIHRPRPKPVVRPLNSRGVETGIDDQHWNCVVAVRRRPDRHPGGWVNGPAVKRSRDTPLRAHAPIR